MSIRTACLVDAHLVLAGQVLDWAARNASRASLRHDFERAAQWAEIGGKITGHFGSAVLAHGEIEAMLRDAVPRSSMPARQRTASLGWLHVFSESYRTGGHTALAKRWIDLDPSEDCHHLVLTNQTLEKAAPALLDAVRKRGGTVTTLWGNDLAVTRRAGRLRELANSFDAVVLHVHPWDTVPLLAFGVSGGPPVFFTNHADHLFWFGGSISDLVLNIRPSGQALCAAYRGVDRSMRFPLPLPLPDAVSGDASGQVLRASLGIPANAVVFLTIGSRFKYLPIESFSFIDAASRLLLRNPSAFLIAVGPSHTDDGWPALCTQFGHRAHVVGSQTDIQPYLAASDVYLEGFPFGSLTALLEAVMAGLPPVLAPAQCPLPYRSDDFGLEDLTVATDVDAYVQLATELARDRPRRNLMGIELAKRVRDLHCAPKWSKHLEVLRGLVRGGLRHQTYAVNSVHPMDAHRVRYWASFSLSGSADNAFSWGFRNALERGLKPRVDRKLHRALMEAAAGRVKVSNAWIATLGSALLSSLPQSTAMRIYLRS